MKISELSRLAKISPRDMMRIASCQYDFGFPRRQ